MKYYVVSHPEHCLLRKLGQRALKTWRKHQRMSDPKSPPCASQRHGVAAGAPVVAVRVFDSNGSGSWSAVIKGVDYVAQNCVSSDVANMSLGGSYYKPVNDAVIAASGKCPFFIAAGNSGANAGKYSPASANGPNVYTVSAFGSGDTWASFSNYGRVVDYAEPGVDIHSTWKGGVYNTISGTSMATPHLAGVKLVGSITTNGKVNNDPDGKPDPIGVC